MLNIFFLEKLSLIFLMTLYVTYTINNLNVISLKYKTNWIGATTYMLVFLLILVYITLNLSNYMSIKVNATLFITNLVLLFIFKNPITLLFTYTLNIILYTLFTVSSVLELLLVVELINVVILFIILTDKRLFIYDKKVLNVLISVNVITLSLLVITYLHVSYIYKTTNLGIVFLGNMLNLSISVQIILILSIFIKLGLITGPKLNSIFYRYLKKDFLCLYIYTYYLILPILLIPVILINNINVFITITTIVCVLILNSLYFSSLKTQRDLIFLSGQINLIYISLLLLL